MTPYEALWTHMQPHKWVSFAALEIFVQHILQCQALCSFYVRCRHAPHLRRHDCSRRHAAMIFVGWWCTHSAHLHVCDMDVIINAIETSQETKENTLDLLSSGHLPRPRGLCGLRAWNGLAKLQFLKVDIDHNSMPQQRRPGNVEFGHCMPFFRGSRFYRRKNKGSSQKKKAPAMAQSKKVPCLMRGKMHA